MNLCILIYLLPLLQHLPATPIHLPPPHLLPAITANA